jgi:DNA repair exonuclease SbcCD ATPase subunit
MPELSQDAIHELRQSLRVLGMLGELFTRLDFQTGDELRQLIRAYDRISELTSSAEVETWVGDLLIDVLRVEEQQQDWEYWRNDGEIMHMAWSLSQRLHTYVETRLDSEKIREALDRLTQENTSLKEQVAELRERESTWFSIMREARTSARYSPPQRETEDILDSLKREHATHTKNLRSLEETKAKYGPLDVPLHIQNSIDEIQEVLKPIESTIGYLEANITKMK